MTNLLAWLRDVLCGPNCPRCGWPTRGHRTLATHLDTCRSPR